MCHALLPVWHLLTMIPMVKIHRCLWPALALAVLSWSCSAGAQTLRVAHCLAGCPRGAAPDNDLIIRSLYTLSFNHQTRVADWVAYSVSQGSIGVASNLSREPLPDPYVADVLTVEDYEGSVSGAQVERALFVPLVSFAGTPYWQEVNYLTNMVPRNPELSRGSWYGLEWAVRNLASRGGEVYVLSGPLFEDLRFSVRSAAGIPRAPL